MYLYDILSLLSHLGMPKEGRLQVGDAITRNDNVSFSAGSLNITIDKLPGTSQYSINIM